MTQTQGAMWFRPPVPPSSRKQPLKALQQESLWCRSLFSKVCLLSYSPVQSPLQLTPSTSFIYNAASTLCYAALSLRILSLDVTTRGEACCPPSPLSLLVSSLHLCSLCWLCGPKKKSHFFCFCFPRALCVAVHAAFLTSPWFDFCFFAMRMCLGTHLEAKVLFHLGGYKGGIMDIKIKRIGSKSWNPAFLSSVCSSSKDG